MQLPVSGDAICYGAGGAISGKVVCCYVVCAISGGVSCYCAI